MANEEIPDEHKEPIQAGLLAGTGKDLHSGNLILKKSFLQYFLRECSSFTKEMNIKWFFVVTKMPFLVSSPVRVKESVKKELLL